MTQSVITKTSIVICSGEVRTIQFDRATQMEVDCSAGRNLWLTRLGDPEDYWLAVGDRLHFARGQQVTVSIGRHDGAARITLLSSEVCNPGQPALRVALRRLATTLRAALPSLYSKPRAALPRSPYADRTS